MRQLDPAADFGVIFAAKGEIYRKLARRAARNVRQAMPDTPIDLFADTEVEDPIFSRVHRLDPTIKNPKMAALLHSRFRRTLYLDCDVIMLIGVPEIFEMLETFEFVGAHEQFGSSPIHSQIVRRPLPVSFRQINGGVLGFRVTDRIEAFLNRWRSDYEALKLNRDQPILRELLYDADLKMAVLPMEYNQMYPPFVARANPWMMAPRMVHITRLHVGDQHTEPVDQPFNLAQLYPPVARDSFNALLKTDRTLGNAPNIQVLAGEMLRRAPRLDRFVRNVRKLFD